MNSGQDIAQQTRAIRDALGKIDVQLASYEQVSKQFQGSENVGHKAKIAVAHNALTNDGIKLLQSIRGPLDSVYEHFERVGKFHPSGRILGIFVAHNNGRGLPSRLHKQPPFELSWQWEYLRRFQLKALLLRLSSPVLLPSTRNSWVRLYGATTLAAHALRD
jgi:hypothetical protein